MLFYKMVVGNNTLKLYNYQNIEEYYNYIFESFINGNFGQFKDLILSLSKPQQKSFYSYMELNDYVFMEEEEMKEIKRRFVEVIIK